MAIRPADQYAAQITTGDVGYPHGKAKNVVVTGDGSGTPLEQAWLNDLFGFQQALLDESGITPSGTPDQVGASQYLDALKAIIADYLPIRWVGAVDCEPGTPTVITSWGPAPNSVAYSGFGLAVSWTTPPWEQESSNLMVSLVASATNSRDRLANGGLNAGDDIFCHVWDTISNAEVNLNGTYETLNFVILGTKI